MIARGFAPVLVFTVGEHFLRPFALDRCHPDLARPLPVKLLRLLLPGTHGRLSLFEAKLVAGDGCAF